MDDAFRFCDDLGPAKIVHIHRPAVGLRAVVAVDNVACGPAIGGVRLAPDVSTEEAFRLARAMTLKNAAAGLPHGGAKSVIFGDPKMPVAEKERLVRAFACAIADITDYIPGPDMGTDERCMAWIKDENGRAAGLPPELGGIPLDEIGATAYGLVSALEVAEALSYLTIDGATVAIQGFGSVGQHAARFLAEKGARLVAASDSGGTVVDAGGLDVAGLIALKRAGGGVVEHGAGETGDRDAIIDVECDVWIPAARPDVIHASNVERLRTRVVAQGANIPLTEEAEAHLHANGVLVLPDFIANAGGVICASVEYHGGTRSGAFDAIAEKIGANTRAVLEGARASGRPPRPVAMELAEARVRAAMVLRRWG